MELDHHSEDSETAKQWNVTAAPNVPGLIRPIRRLEKKVEKMLMIVNIVETRRNKRIKKK
jgi:hypothetical protein